MEEVSICVVCVCVCACRSAYFFRFDVFTVRHFLALCLGVVMGRFVPLPGTAVFVGRTSTPEEEVEEQEDEDECRSAEDANSAELASSSVFHSQPERPREASKKDAPSLPTARDTFKVILGFINMGIFLARPFFFSSWLATTHSAKSTVFGVTVGWQDTKKVLMLKTHGVALHPGIGHSQSIFSCLYMATARFNGTTHGHVLLICYWHKEATDPMRGEEWLCSRENKDVREATSK